jgi:hypothetical protein
MSATSSQRQPSKSERYSWLSSAQAVGKMAEIKIGDDAYLTYDILTIK